MRLRPALPTDEPQMASICARALFNDDLFGRVIHPRRSTYPDDVQIHWHEFLRRDWVSPRTRTFVAVSEPTSQDAERIIGVAIWQRQGYDAGAATETCSQDSSHTSPAWPDLETSNNRALDPSKKTLLEDTDPYVKDYWSGPRARTWYLALCCVDPVYQQHGCGRLLVRWGLLRAAQEGVCASVIASDGSTNFYLKCGFDEVVENASQVGGEANAMVRAGVKGGDVLFTKVG
jgi:GNAT superfamily N-acetyltransferase